MAERTDEPDFAWYRLQGREIAALGIVGVILVALSVWALAFDGGAPQPEVIWRELPAATVNVNTASLSELTALPGVGERKAEKIITARQQAPISTLEELAKAAGGIPTKDIERMKPYVVFK